MLFVWSFLFIFGRLFANPVPAGDNIEGSDSGDDVAELDEIQAWLDGLPSPDLNSPPVLQIAENEGGPLQVVNVSSQVERPVAGTSQSTEGQPPWQRPQIRVTPRTEPTPRREPEPQREPEVIDLAAGEDDDVILLDNPRDSGPQILIEDGINFGPHGPPHLPPSGEFVFPFYGHPCSWRTCWYFRQHVQRFVVSTISILNSKISATSEE